MPTQDDNKTEEITEDEIDESLEESFPASDPPSWTLGHDPHSEEEDKNDK